MKKYDKTDIESLLRRSTSWIIVSHLRPDGDTLGSASAFFSYGQTLGKRCFWCGTDPIPDNLQFIPHASHYNTTLDNLGNLPEETCIIALDISHESRCMEEIWNIKLNKRIPLVVIDHHSDNSCFGDLHFIDSSASATGEMLYFFFNDNEWPLTRDAALGLYTAIYTDSGGFRYGNTTSKTHRVAAALLDKGVSPVAVDEHINGKQPLGVMHLRGLALSRVEYCCEKRVAWSYVTEEDFHSTNTNRDHLEGLASQLLRTDGVDFSIFLYQEKERIYGSLRSKGVVSAQDMAKFLGGGGHPQASGFSADMTIDGAFGELKRELRRAYGKTGNPSH